MVPGLLFSYYLARDAQRGPVEVAAVETKPYEG